MSVAGQHTVETLVVLQPIAVDTGSPDREGMLVIANGMLIAVLVQINDCEVGNNGSWFLEVGLGQLRGLRLPKFNTLQDAVRSLRQHVIASRLTN